MGDTGHIHGNSAYRAEFASAAEQLAEAGASNTEIAATFGVASRTLSRWRHQYPLIDKAIAAGRARARALAEYALHERAIGFSSVTEKVVDGFNGPAVHRVQEYHPPDPLAARIWMQRRRAGDASANLATLHGDQGQ